MEQDDTRLAEENLGLVRLCAGRLAGKGAPYEELVAAGNLGLTKAAKGFDPTLGYRFSTYAVPVILGEMRALLRQQSPVKAGRKLRQNAGECAAFRERFLAEHGREPTVSQVCQATGLTSEEVVQTLEVFTPPLSLTASPEEGGMEPKEDSRQGEMLDRLAVQQVLDRLPAQERQLIWLRYYQNFTQGQTAKQLGISQAQVSRKEKAVLAKMRQWLE